MEWHSPDTAKRSRRVLIVHEYTYTNAGSGQLNIVKELAIAVKRRTDNRFYLCDSHKLVEALLWAELPEIPNE